MFEILMDLPLFRGVTRARLAQTVGEAKFHFLKFPPGELIVRADEPCTHLTFIISGAVRSQIVNRSGRFAVSQTLAAPAVISPDFLFGRFTNYPGDVTAIDSVGVLKISKSDYLKILHSDQVFMFNYLNTLSVNAQKALKGVLSLTTGEVDERIAFWIIALTQPGATDITLSCRKRDLCSLFGVPRAVFDASLESMLARGFLKSYDNKVININNRADLLALLEHNSEERPYDPTER